LTPSQTWLLCNSGDIKWPEGCTLKCIETNGLEGPDAIDLPCARVNANVDVTVPLTVPETDGAYQSAWRATDPDGDWFGSKVWVQVRVDTSPDVAEKLGAAGEKVGAFFGEAASKLGTAMRDATPLEDLFPALSFKRKKSQTAGTLQGPDEEEKGRESP